MTHFELIDDYLTNRLAEADKVEFEKQMVSDPSLKADVELQRNILESIKKARALELKTMLNNVPLTGLNGGFTAGKIAAAIATVGLVSTGLYYYLTSTANDQSVLAPQEVVTDNPPQPENLNSSPNDSTPAVIEDENKDKDKPAVDAKDPAVDKANANKAVKEPVARENRPKIEVIDPTQELSVESENGQAETHGVKTEVNTSHIAVETNSSSKKHNFHYQFSNGKLMLYGPFDDSLYEIIEISGDTHAVFLFYKENYYLLDENQTDITALHPIKDGNLIKKLKEYRHQ